MFKHRSRSHRYTTAAAILSLSACGSSSEMDTSLPSTTGNPSTAASAQHPAVEAYLAMWGDVAAASANSDWQAPQLDDHATGAALTTITDALRDDHAKGLVARGEPTHVAKLSELDPKAEPRVAVVADCADDSTWLRYRADTGQLVDDVPGGRRAISAEVTLSADGTWKVSKFVVQEVGSCG